MQPQITALDEETLKGELKGLVRKTVEEAVDGILDAQADETADAEGRGRTDERQAYRSGHYKRGLLAQAGKIEAGVPKLRGARLAAEAVGRRRGREGPAGEALTETRLPGAPAGGVEDVAKVLWDEGVSAGAVSGPDQEASRRAGVRRRRPLACDCPYACVDGTCVKRSWGGACGGVAALVAIGVDADGFREAVGAGEGCKESQGSWREFLLGMRQRGLSGARMAAGDKSAGTLGALREAFPDATRRRRAARSCRNVLAKVPQRRREAVAAQLKAVHAQEPLAASARKAREVAGSLRTSKLSGAARVFEEGCMETLTCARFPPEHWRRIRTNNGIGRLNRETERRTKAVASFPDGEAAAMLAAARLQHVAEGNWGSRRRLDVSLLDGWDERSIAES